MFGEKIRSDLIIFSDLFQKYELLSLDERFVVSDMVEIIKNSESEPDEVDMALSTLESALFD